MRIQSLLPKSRLIWKRRLVEGETTPVVMALLVFEDIDDVWKRKIRQDLLSSRFFQHTYMCSLTSIVTLMKCHHAKCLYIIVNYERRCTIVYYILTDCNAAKASWKKSKGNKT